MQVERFEKVRWKEGAHIKVDAQTCSEVCIKLADEGRLTAANLVDVSRPVDAPLHEGFEWDNDVAGEKWREYQAGHMIRSLVYEVECQNKPPVLTRVFVTTIEPKTYEPLDVVVKSPDKIQALKEQALTDLRNFAKKYRALNEILPGFDELIGQIELELS